MELLAVGQWQQSGVQAGTYSKAQIKHRFRVLPVANKRIYRIL